LCVQSKQCKDSQNLGGSTALAASLCSGGGRTSTITFPSTINVARDLPVGTLLTNWVVVSGTTSDWTCDFGASGAHNWGPASVATNFTTNSGVSVSYNGVSARALKTSVPGVGIAILMNGYAAGGWSGWTEVRSSWYGGYWGNGGGSQSLGVYIVAALVKTGTVTGTGQIAGGTTVAQSGVYVDSGVGSTVNSYQISAVKVTGMSCTTPNVTIPMGDHPATEFPAVGSLSSQPVQFSLDFNNCDAAVTRLPGATTSTGQINGVTYLIQPGATVAGFTNVAAITGGTGAAQGVGIQLYKSDGTVFPLNTTMSLSNFNSTAGGDYSVPLTARYYRTGTIVPGTANATMLVIATYL
jgi:major type 1 subunit fimbrin (pilin)